MATALTAISDTVKKYTNTQNTESLLLRRLGIAGEALKMLKDFGALTGQLAKFVPYVSAAFEVLKAFNILSDGSDAVSPAMPQRFNQLNALIIAHQKQWAEVTSAGYQNKVLTSLESVSRYAEQTRVWLDVPASQISWTTLHTERALHRTYSIQEAHADLLSFLNPSLWHSQRPGPDPEEPEHTFDPLRPLWLSLPDENGEWKPAPPEHTGFASSFDHRMMVPIVPSLIGSYLTMVQTLLPEYRSVGTYRTKLLALATQIEQLLDLMRTMNLARTDYSGFDLSDDFDGELPGLGRVRVPKRRRLDHPDRDRKHPHGRATGNRCPRLPRARTRPPGRGDPRRRTRPLTTGWYERKVLLPMRNTRFGSSEYRCQCPRAPLSVMLADR